MVAGRLVSRGNVLARGRQYDGAFAAYDKALTVKPDFAEAFNHLGLAVPSIVEIARVADLACANGWKLQCSPGRHLVGDNIFVSVLEVSGSGKLLSSFAPTGWAQNNEGDVGLGSQGVALVGTRWAVLGGKSGPVYVLRQGDLGGIGGGWVDPFSPRI